FTLCIIFPYTTLFRSFGVQNDKPIIIYGADNDMFAGRAWWLLHYLGHPEVYVLDGGYKAWVQQDYETTADIPIVNPSNWEGETKDRKSTRLNSSHVSI